MKKLAIALVMGTSLLLIQSAAFAQKSETPASGSTVSEQDIQLLRSDIRSTKKQIIAENMKLTDAQGAKSFGRSTTPTLRRPRSWVMPVTLSSRNTRKATTT